MDGIALYFLGRNIFPLLSVALDGYRLSFVLLPVWLLLASLSGRPLWKAATCSRGFVIGLCGYSIWLVAELILGRSPDAVRQISWLLVTALPIYLMGSFYGYQHPDRFWKIVRILLALIGVQATYSLPYLIAGAWDPKLIMHAIRLFGETRGGALLLGAARHGIGGYDLYMNTAVIVAIVAGHAIYKRRGWLSRSFWVSAWVFIVLANIESTFSASALVALFATVSVLVYAVITRRLALSTTLILFAIIGLFGGLALNRVQTSEGYDYTFTKLSDIFESVDKGGIRSETTGRGELLFVSLDAFVKSPIVGYGAEGANTAAANRSISGGHSTWLNILVAYGLGGGVWFFVMVYSVGREIRRAIRRRPGDLLAISFMIAYLSYLIYGTINTIMIDVVFFFLLYGGALALQRQLPVDQSANGITACPTQPRPRDFTFQARRPYPAPRGDR